MRRASSPVIYFWAACTFSAPVRHTEMISSWQQNSTRECKIWYFHLNSRPRNKESCNISTHWNLRENPETVKEVLHIHQRRLQCWVLLSILKILKRNWNRKLWIFSPRLSWNKWNAQRSAANRTGTLLSCRHSPTPGPAAGIKPSVFTWLRHKWTKKLAES